MPFRPNPNDTITIADSTYIFSEHPAAPGMAYGQAGRRGTVYQLADAQGGLWALKVFLRQYCEPRLAGQAERLQALAALPGLRAAERAVLTSSQHRALIRENLDLAYAVQMPWISGRTWMEVILSRELLPPLESLQRASALAAALVGMEERGLAHCDLSGPNLILPPEGGVELVDLEEMYGPELMKPEQLPGGSPGYAHRTAPQGLWNSRADRFSGAVLLAEMLGWCDERVVETAWGEGYFQPEEMSEESERSRLLKKVLAERWGQGPAELFGRAWGADTLAMSPTFNEWAA
ncbi:MAG: hypothetical protein JXA25_13455, partial [Anaerolineales bacterium]|nr:hypothetical protein [Anaerolineales bacterium]